MLAYSVEVHAHDNSISMCTIIHISYPLHMTTVLIAYYNTSYPLQLNPIICIENNGRKFIFYIALVFD